MILVESMRAGSVALAPRTSVTPAEIHVTFCDSKSKSKSAVGANTLTTTYRGSQASAY